MSELRLTLDGALSEFKAKYGLADEQCDIVKKEIEAIVSVGSDEGKLEGIEGLFKEYEECKYLRVLSLGGGAFGMVYRGIHLLSKEEVAIKLIDLEESKADPVTISREVISLALGGSCDQLVQYRCSVVIGTVLWIVMEYCKGGSVLNMINRHGSIPEAACAVIIREALKGLLYLSESDRAHRDIKVRWGLITFLKL